MAQDITGDANSKKNKALSPAEKAAEKQKKANEEKSRQAQAQKKPKKSIRKFFRDTKSEFSKVVWPKRQQVVNSTIVVLISIAGTGILVFALDTLFNFVLRIALQMG